MIRRATEQDVPHIVAMAQRFVDTTVYRERIAIAPARIETLARQMLAHEDMAGFVSEREGAVVGMLGLHIYEHPMNGARVAAETVWWMDPEHRGTDGLRLLRAGEGWARAQGASRLFMVAPTPQIEDLYRRLGYSALETTYERRL